MAEVPDRQRLSKLTGISEDKLTELGLDSFDNAIVVEDDQAHEGVGLGGWKRLLHVRDYLVDGNTISSETKLSDIVKRNNELKQRQAKVQKFANGDVHGSPVQADESQLSGMTHEDAIKFFQKFLEENRYIGSFESDEPSAFCYPFELRVTYNEDRIRAALLKLHRQCIENHDAFDPQSPVIILIRQGLGNGKTHTLLQAPRLLGFKNGPMPMNYITYNGDQSVEIDKKEPRKCLLIRLLSNALGYGNFTAAKLLSQSAFQALLSKLSLKYLRNLVVKAMFQKYQYQVCVCVDELRMLMIRTLDIETGKEELSNSAVREILSELRQVSHLLHVHHNTICTVIVTALSKATVATSSERNLLPLELTTSADAVDVIAESFKISDSSIRWKVRAVAGNHMRSIVVACNLISNGHSHIELPVLYEKVFDGLRSPIYNHNPEAIVKYIKESCRYGGCGLTSCLPDKSEIILDSQNGVPPAITLECLKQNQKPQFEEVFSIFESTIYTHAPKQLEKSALHYDLLRSLWGLPVIPTKMIVYEKGHGIATKEFEEFAFPEFLPEVSGEGLFKLSGKKVVWAGLTPVSATYYHPMADNHPWVDRFFATKYKDKALIVLYQDKINAEGFSDAVQKLNFAVDMIKKNLPEYKLLCVLNVVGASSQTRKQNDLKAPYVLVRSDEVKQFYTVHFAPAIQFLRKRFLDEGGDEFRYSGDP